MASLGFSLSNARSLYPPLKLGFPSKPRIPSISTLNFSSTLRCIGARRLQINQKKLSVSAVNSNSSDGKASNENVKESSNVSKGPPLLTILFGLLVFYIAVRVIGFIVMWLVSLIVNVPPPK
ncbi:uncharacterized protein LOC131594954 [Vicia villosa]|uniref:uncharacterized protein LOC131594954 n=1 Tax=Vicia villosa TaxID=3911 RepID=UPI00273C82FC|nr:uncharacterized protein LOC131594954 [Vicia villosa]